MSLAREDVLRELELLPVWNLRAPLPAQITGESIPPVSVLATNVAIIETPQAIENPAVLIASDDKKWLFVLPAELTGQAADLFNNILLALHINKTQMKNTQELAQDIEQFGANVIVAMGEVVAQQLLTSMESLENLRGKIHLLNGAQVVVTYHPEELLQQPSNKAKAWDDLCLALNILNT